MTINSGTSEEFIGVRVNTPMAFYSSNFHLKIGNGIIETHVLRPNLSILDLLDLFA